MSEILIYHGLFNECSKKLPKIKKSILSSYSQPNKKKQKNVGVATMEDN